MAGDGVPTAPSGGHNPDPDVGDSAAAGSAPPAPGLRAIRGAVTAARDEPAAIYGATRELLSAIMERNGLSPDDVISVIFTVTPDLTSAFPALAARQMGWLEVPLLCTMEIPVPGALERCIRVLLYVESARPRQQMQHVYLSAAEILRPDLSLAEFADRADPLPTRPPNRNPRLSPTSGSDPRG